ncbi:hypothetical protein ACFSHT_34980 [Paraburkholderia silviterrae]|uniref:Uncharacterized protein n=1 Tax=Paraburkholderia silviterrae TaxID=2528715 RepID=A0A4R5M6I7_9BURK|nr:hypothetical protein [Paraburkholderia silviterrae]TDG21590.1 hypothetical protein EYW47_22310 [Paraburkholderia silviterrae]
MEITPTAASGAQTAPRRRHAGTRTAWAIVIALGLVALAYWRADPAALAREAYRACAGDAASALHAQDARRREQALETLTDCAAKR